MLSSRLRDFVNIVKITHNIQCQLSGPLARVLMSNWHCKYTKYYWVYEIKREKNTQIPYIIIAFLMQKPMLRDYTASYGSLE